MTGDQLSMPMPAQARASREQSPRVWAAIVSLRKQGLIVYRAGHLHKVIQSRGIPRRSSRGRHLTSRQLVAFARGAP